MSVFYWVVEYLASFIEVIMCNYFCGTILNKERLNEKKSVITFVSFVIAVAVIIFNRIELFTSVININVFTSYLYDKSISIFISCVI